MQRVMEDTGYANSIQIYLERCRGDVWTLEMKDRGQKDLALFEPFKHDLKKKICIGTVMGEGSARETHAFTVLVAKPVIWGACAA
jgi:hypothetical protein